VQVEDDQPHSLDLLLLGAGLELGRSHRAIRSHSRANLIHGTGGPSRVPSRGGHERLIAALATHDVDEARAAMHDDVAATEAAIRGLLAHRGITLDP
jgi:DNA-binding GntR family transcriptional regulator